MPTSAAKMYLPNSGKDKLGDQERKNKFPSEVKKP
jgi:hypothetical protein